MKLVLVVTVITNKKPDTLRSVQFWQSFIPESRWQAIKRLAPILAIQFVGMLGYSLVIPFLVIVVTQLGGNAVIYGIVGSMYPLFQFVGAPILGQWSDRRGRKVVLLLSQLGTLFSWFLFLIGLLLPHWVVWHHDSLLLGSFVITVPLLVIAAARMFDGLTGGNISVAQAYVADIASDHNRTKYFGWLSVATSMGFVVGPALAGVLGATSWGVLPPVIAAIAVSTVTSIIVWLGLPNDQVVSQKTRVSARARVTSSENIRKVLAIPRVRYVVLLYFLLFLGFNFFYSAFPVFATRGLGWSVAQMGVFFSIMSIMMVLVQGPMLHTLSKRVGNVPLILGGGILLATNFGLMAVGLGWLAWTASVLFALGNGLMWPSFLAVISKIATKEQQGLVQGVTASAGSLAAILGMLFGGFGYEHLGSRVFLLSMSLVLTVVLFSRPMAGWSELKSTGVGLSSK